ncbi:MAG: nucleotidyltransferase family protein [Thiobacillaceae bacterium]|jgi:hypothetical protein|nr:nucleotidyltransferase family protein [Thiobacillaceae bacterium]
MRMPAELVSHVFRDPAAIQRFSMDDWDRLVRQARQADLLARLHARLQQDGLDAAIPAVARWHFEAATALAGSQQKEMRQKLRRLRELLAGLDIPLVVLKGAAYVAAGLPAASGRCIDDLDLLVPGERLNEVESALQRTGWHAVDLPDYDRRYYRRWRYDAPQLQHLRRATAINLHYAIVPNTARFHPDAAKLRRRAVEIPGLTGLAILSAEDRILHAAILLFHDDELSHGLRDLSDLDLLLRRDATGQEFWSRLLARADEMELSRPLFYALRFARHFFATPVPDEVRDHLRSAEPGSATLKLMDGIYTRMLAPAHRSCMDAFTPPARAATYLRTHWLRRPPRQLVPHLVYKAFVSPYQREPNPA